jgi:hypothetical protein
MRITSAGLVGIGTTTPDQTLHVMKASAGSIASDSNTVLTIENDDTAVLSILCPEANNGYIIFGNPNDGNADGRLRYNNSTREMSLWTSATERLTILDDGLVGIGTSDHDPIRELEVHNATGDCTFRIASDNSNNQTIMIELAAGTNGPSGGGYVQSTIYLIGNETSSSQVLNFKLIDNSSIKMFLDNAGINGTLVGSSDEALKENVEDLSDGTTVIKALRPRIFDWKTDEEYAGTGTGQAGFIAQEVESVFSEAVSGVEGRKGIKIMAILAHAVKAIQELEERIETLENA